ncbi:MAG: metalloregulator ArsR/SmtB family transcription factor [Pseudomonadota bacterium]
MPNNQDIELDQLFSALADPTRRAVVQMLVEKQNASVSELHAPHAMALPSFTQHLKVLEDAGLISTRKQGRVRMVNIEAQTLTKAQKWLEHQRKVWEARFDRLDALLSKDHKEGDDT